MAETPITRHIQILSSTAEEMISLSRLMDELGQLLDRNRVLYTLRLVGVVGIYCVPLWFCAEHPDRDIAFVPWDQEAQDYFQREADRGYTSNIEGPGNTHGTCITENHVAEGRAT